MIYITGDVHAQYGRFSNKHFPQQKELTKEDTVLICGDFGVQQEIPEHKHWMDWLEQRNFTTAFIDGNHCDFDLLETLPQARWKEGAVHVIRPSVLHMMRGQIFTVDGLTFFVMGGAASHDISGGILEPGDPLLRQKKKWLKLRGEDYRIHHVTWWEQELPSREECEQAERNLEACHWRVDYVVTHCAPASIQDMLTGEDGEYPQNYFTEFLERVKNRLEFKRWYFGHYHREAILENGKFQALYESVIPLR